MKVEEKSIREKVENHECCDGNKVGTMTDTIVKCCCEKEEPLTKSEFECCCDDLEEEVEEDTLDCCCDIFSYERPSDDNTQKTKRKSCC